MTESNFSPTWRSSGIPRTGESIFFGSLAAILLLYALLSRVGAHIGIPLSEDTGLYVGELVLIFGLLLLLLNGTFLAFFESPVALIWAFFILWNASQTLPYIHRYGLLALRDGAIWGYSFYAVIVSCFLIAQPQNLVSLVRYYRWFARIFPFLLPILFAGSIWALEADVPEALPFKSGEGLTHIVAMVAFASCGFMRVSFIWWVMVGADVLLVATQNRGAMLAFFMGAVTLCMANPASIRRSRPVLGILGLGAVIAVLLGLKVDVANSERDRQR